MDTLHSEYFISETDWNEAHDEEVNEYLLRGGGRYEAYYDETDFEEPYASNLMLEDIDDYEERDTYMYFFEIRLNDCLDIALAKYKNKMKYLDVINQISMLPPYVRIHIEKYEEDGEEKEIIIKQFPSFVGGINYIHGEFRYNGIFD